MANVVGALLVKLGLDTSEYTTGFTKADAQAKKFTESTSANFKKLATTIAGLGIGAAVVAMFKDTVDSAAALDDLSDATGSSVEALSKLSNQAKIAGADFDTMQGALLKLSVNMTETGDASSDTARALKLLGITTRDPAEAMQQIAVALNKYADGLGKVAISKALFDKAGPGFLATLKDIAESQDVVGTTSTKMAADAEALQKSLRRLSVEGTLLKDLILSGIVPALVEFVRMVNDASRFTGNLADGLRALGQLGLFKTAAENAAYLNKEIADLEDKISKIQSGDNFWVKYFGSSRDTTMLETQLKSLKAARDIAEASVLRGFGGPPTNERIKKPDLPFAPKGKTEADEFTKAMERARQAAIEADIAYREAFSGEKFTPAQKALEKIVATTEFSKLDAGSQRAIKTAYTEIAAREKQTVAVEKEREERQKLIKTYEDLADAQEKAKVAATAALGQFAEQNDSLEKQIKIVGKGQEAWALLNAEEEQNKRIAQARAAGDELTVKAMETQYDRQKKLIGAYYEAQAALERQIELNRIFVDSFSDAIVGIVTGTKSIKQAFLDMEKSIVEAITRIAARKIANAIFGVDDQGGGGVGSWLGRLIPALFGAAGTGGGASPSFAGIPNPGIGSLADGTDFWRGGLTMVGERGPELISLPRGAKVTPTGKLAPVINIAVHQAAGASRASTEQLAAETGRAVQRAMRSVR